MPRNFGSRPVSFVSRRSLRGYKPSLQALPLEVSGSLSDGILSGGLITYNPSLVVTSIAADINLKPEDTQGIISCIVAILGISYVVIDGKRQIAEIKEELETKYGFDTKGIDRIGSLKFLKKEFEKGDGSEKVAVEMVNCARTEQAMAFGTTLDIVTWREYWGERGVTFNTIADMDKVKQYVKNLKDKQAGKALRNQCLDGPPARWNPRPSPHKNYLDTPVGAVSDQSLPLDWKRVGRDTTIAGRSWK